MKVPSLEEFGYMLLKGLQAFEKEIEEVVEWIVDKFKEMFGR